MCKINLIISIYLMLAVMLTACSKVAETETSNSSTTTASVSLPSEKPSTTPALTDEEYAIGNTVRFGGYEWIVLDVRDGKALLLTNTIIAIKYSYISHVAEVALKTLAKETMPYWNLSDFEGYVYNNPKYDDIYEKYTKYVSVNPKAKVMYQAGPASWETSPIREWLNNEMDFTPSEWDKIEKTEIIDKAGFGSNTTDKVFLLSSDEIQKYFPLNESRNVALRVSDEVKLRLLQDMLLLGMLSGDMAKGILKSGNFHWWCRESDNEKYYLKPISTDNYLGGIAGATSSLVGGIRPAIWISVQP